MKLSYSFINYLVETYSITESFKDAQNLFSKDNDDVTVDETLNKFKQLLNANRIKPEYKDITQWMKKPFEELHKFVRQLEITPSGKQTKKDVKSNSITLKVFGDWIALIPLSKGASCFYGKGTEWCTAATKSDNYFDSYFDRGITLIYFINKSHGTRFAVAIGKGNADYVNTECFDERDNTISRMELASELGISENELWHIVLDASEHEKVQSTRDTSVYTKLAEFVKELLNKHVNDNAAYHSFLEIGKTLDDEKLPKAVDAATIEKLKQKQKDCYASYIRYHIGLVMDSLKLIKHLLTKPEEELLKYSIYIRGSLSEFLRQANRLPSGFEKYGDATDINEINKAEKTTRKILDAIHKQQQAQQ
jgi:hypothetical protein